MTDSPNVTPAGPRPSDDVSLLSWLQNVADRNVPATLGPAKVPVAWVGRTSTEDNQDPTLSLPRQLDASRHALPDEFVIVAHFYDVESGRTLEEFRGHGHGHEHFDIPIPRDGGIATLLEEARRPDRRFVAVICESIDRVARTTYFGTKFEHDLEQAGVALLAADEGIDRRTIPALAEGDGPVKRATPTLTRRVKQAISEWYVLNMLELAWGGFKTHTDQGYNIGKPPYGYLAKPLRHPVEAKALQGRHKHKLVADPTNGRVVTQIFQWRALERLSYQAIADRLNLDPDRYPPPEPIPGKGRRRIGAWTYGSVREVLDNPKHTGYMVWNRRKRSRATRGVKGRVNPPHLWVWSRLPTHEPLITRTLFEAASTVARFRRGSRSEPGPNSHPETTRVYLMRSFLYCQLCGRRMWGGTKRTLTYYHCKKSDKNHAHLPWYHEHPAHVLIREDELLPIVARFFKHRVFGPVRKSFLQDSGSVGRTDLDLDHRRRAVQTELVDLQRRQNNLMQELERFSPSGDPDFDDAWRGGIQTRFAANAAEQRSKTRLLADLTRQREAAAAPDTSLIDALPQEIIDVTMLPEEQQRRLYDAFHLEIRYDVLTHSATLCVSLDAETVPALLRTIETATAPPAAPVAGVPVPDTIDGLSLPAARYTGWDAQRVLPGAPILTSTSRPLTRCYTVSGLSHMFGCVQPSPATYGRSQQMRGGLGPLSDPMPFADEVAGMPGARTHVRLVDRAEPFQASRCSRVATRTFVQDLAPAPSRSSLRPGNRTTVRRVGDRCRSPGRMCGLRALRSPPCRADHGRLLRGTIPRLKSYSGHHHDQ